MADFVLDCSVAVSWCFEDEQDDYSLGVLEFLSKQVAVVPSLWYYEVCNVLLNAQKQKRASQAVVSNFLNSLNQLPIEVISSANSSMQDLILISARYDLTVYDGSYLDLALKLGVPIATLDKKLIAAVQKSGGKLLKL
ncbi:MAG: type II toxin-antitoxin system VapC family toxin [Rickettsiales bacterium]